MSRRTALVRPRPIRTDDCFAQFDAVFDALATELSWTEAAREPVEASEGERVETQKALDLTPVNPVAGSPLIPDEDLDALDNLLAEHTVEAETGARGRAPESAADGAGLDAAFARLDARLLRADEGQRGLVPHLRLAPSLARPWSVSRQLTDVRRPRPDGHSALENVLALVEDLTGIRDRLALKAEAAGVVDARRAAIATVLADTRQLCEELDLPTASVRAAFATTTLENVEDDRLCHEIDELVRHIRYDLGSCTIWPIAPGRVWALNLTFGSDVDAAFPSAHPDLVEAGLCYSLGRYTASVFHMLRAAEHGLLALARAADARAVASNSDRGIGALVAIVEARVVRLESRPPGHARARALEFFGKSLDEARALRDVARRLAIDDERPIGEHDALGVCHRTKGLLVRLAGRLTEGPGRTLGLRDFASDAPRS